MKYCNGCKNTLPLSSFAKCSRNKSGVQSKCRDCRAVLNADWYDRNIEYARQRSKDRYVENIDYYKNYHKEYSKDNREYLNIKLKEWGALNKDKRNSYKQSYRDKFPGSITNMNLRRRLNKVEEKPSYCEECGTEDYYQLNGHHDDYAKPEEIRWLCPRCHAEWHRQNGEGLNKHLLMEA